MTTERENAGPWFAIQWLLANAAGVAAGLASANAFGQFSYLFAGIIPSVLQWLLLRRKVVGIGWWVLASSIGMVGCGMTFMRLTRGADVHVIWGGAAGGAVYGAVTGAVLHWLLLSYRRDDDAINVLPKKFATVS